MATDFERDEQLERQEQLDQERRKGLGLPSLAPAAGRPPLPREPRAPGVPRVVRGLGAHLGAGLVRDDAEAESSADAMRQGFANGFSGGLAASPLGAFTQIAEEIELAAAAPKPAVDLEARMEQFPELRGVEVPTGNTARFPELAEQNLSGAQPREQDGDLEH